MLDVHTKYRATLGHLIEQVRTLTAANHALRRKLAPFERWARARCDGDTLASTAPVVANSPGAPCWAELKALLED